MSRDVGEDPTHIISRTGEVTDDTVACGSIDFKDVRIAQADRLEGLVYLALCGSCLGLHLVDISRFAFLPFVSKAIIVGGLTTLPMMFSGIVFIRSFAGAASKNEALGANLIGALAGALLQSATFAIGIKALLLVVTALYLLALLYHPRPDYGHATEPDLVPA